MAFLGTDPSINDSSGSDPYALGVIAPGASDEVAGQAIGSVSEYIANNISPAYVQAPKYVNPAGFGGNYVYPVSIVDAAPPNYYSDVSEPPSASGANLTIGGSWILLAAVAIIAYLVYTR